MTSKVYISCYNCRGLRDGNKRRKIFQWLRSKNQDFVYLQETHSTIRDEVIWKKEWNGPICFSHGSRDSKGVMILMRENPNVEITDVKTNEEEGRTLFVTANIYGVETLLVNIYAPNEDDAKFYDNLFTVISEYNLQNTVIGGDYNLVQDLCMDKDGGRHKTNENARKCVIKYMETLDLVDVWRVKNPHKKEYSWRRRKPNLIQCRLDLFLISQCMLNVVQECKIGNSFLSDHSIVCLCLKIENVKRGPGYWKLNCSVLKDIEYIRKIKQVIKDCEMLYEGTGTDKVLFWETLKMNMRSETILYSCNKKRERVKRESELENQIKELECKVLNEQEIESLNSCKRELGHIVESKLKGDIVRSRARHFEENEKSTKYFLSLEKHSQMQK